MGGFNCGLKAVPNQPKWAWTCPCGRGYWDAIKKEFITGDRVGTGEARTRAEYEAHLRECSQCRAQARQDILISVPGEEEGQGTQSSVRVRSSTRRVVSLDSEAAPVPRYHYFLPMEDIHPEVMQKAAKRYLGPEASIKLASNQVGTPGYDIRANTQVTTEMISELKRLSLPLEAATRATRSDGQRPQLLDKRRSRSDRYDARPDPARDPKSYSQTERRFDQPPETKLSQRSERLLQRSEPTPHQQLDRRPYQAPQQLDSSSYRQSDPRLNLQQPQDPRLFPQEDQRPYDQPDPQSYHAYQQPDPRSIQQSDPRSYSQQPQGPRLFQQQDQRPYEQPDPRSYPQPHDTSDYQSPRGSRTAQPYRDYGEESFSSRDPFSLSLPHRFSDRGQQDTRYVPETRRTDPQETIEPQDPSPPRRASTSDPRDPRAARDDSNDVEQLRDGRRRLRDDRGNQDKTRKYRR